MLKRLRSRLHGEDGFTLIELLVVILIIGILAAIAIPSFLNQKGKANDATAKTAARTAQTTLETYYTDNSTYAASTGALISIESALNNASNLRLFASAGSGYTNSGSPSTGYRIAVDSDSGARTFMIDKDASGNVLRLCTINTGSNAGGCKLNSGSSTNGTW